MRSALIEFPQAILTTWPRLVNLSTSLKARLQIPQDCGSPVTPGGPEGCYEKARPAAPGAPSGDQARRKIGQQPGATGKAKVGTGQSNPKQPVVEFRRPLQAEQVADIEGVVERGGLVVQHDVVGAGHPHDEGDAGCRKQGQQVVHVVLVGLGMVGVTDVDAKRQAEQFSAKMVLEPGADDFLAVIEIF